MKKDLTEEKNKINNMISEFFKGPLFNKFNKIDKIEDLKLKNSLKRPKRWNWENFQRNWENWTKRKNKYISKQWKTEL